MPHRAHLPSGRHHLSRADVVGSQRQRMLAAMVAAMAERGYVETPVAEIIRRAGVSRETFYEQFTSKQDCFLAGVRQARDRLDASLATARYFGGDPVPRFDRMIGMFLETLALEPGAARLMLVEVFAAGPDALAELVQVQDRLLAATTETLEPVGGEARFACRILAAGTVSLATAAVLAGDADGIRRLRAPLVELARVSRAVRPAERRPLPR